MFESTNDTVLACAIVFILSMSLKVIRLRVELEFRDVFVCDDGVALDVSSDRGYCCSVLDCLHPFSMDNVA